MGIVHIVMFQFKPELAQDTINDQCNRMLSLKEQCLHPETKQPYLKSVTGGRDNSPEGNQGGITHAFVVEFENDSDRSHYLTADPAHLAFVKGIGEFVVRAQVVDFTPGVL